MGAGKKRHPFWAVKEVLRLDPILLSRNNSLLIVLLLPWFCPLASPPSAIIFPGCTWSGSMPSLGTIQLWQPASWWCRVGDPSVVLWLYLFIQARLVGFFGNTVPSETSDLFALKQLIFPKISQTGFQHYQKSERNFKKFQKVTTWSILLFLLP